MKMLEYGRVEKENMIDVVQTRLHCCGSKHFEEWFKVDILFKFYSLFAH